ncbi:MAG: response regulator [Methylococcales bacterium]|jgi:DNA-binding NarL/FixJ family response regulator|nr:response regulator [Methylococcales bacterium]MBT7408654.1 response regulator [Methylococcales bacterium]
MSSVKTVCIVDDSRVARMMIKAMIKDKQPGWEIKEAGAADELVSAIDGESVDYFSVDMNMPGMNGIELIEKIKPDRPNARFALLTANIQESVKIDVEKLGAKCIHKPITEDSVGKMLDYFNG